MARALRIKPGQATGQAFYFEIETGFDFGARISRADSVAFQKRAFQEPILWPFKSKLAQLSNL